MKSYKQIAETAGVDVETVRVIAKTIKRGETKRGAWLTEDGKTYTTKAQAIEETAKAWKAAEAKRDAQEAARFDGYKVLTVKTARRTTVIVRDMARYTGRTWETAHFGAIPEGVPVQATALTNPETWQTPTLMFGALDERGDVNGVIRWKKRNGTCDVYEADAHKDGARLDVEISKITDGGEPHSILTTWAKRGHVQPMREAWHVETCVTEPDGNMHGGWPNPTITPGGSIDFEWIREATAANRWLLLVETLKRWAE